LSISKLPSRRQTIEVRISHDEFVVVSFPGPDRSIRLEDLQAGRAVSRRYRNRRIGEFLKELDLTEGRSTGIPKILKVMAANGSPAPLFESDDDRLSFVIRLPSHPLAMAESHPPTKLPGKSPGKLRGYFGRWMARCRASRFRRRWLSSTRIISAMLT
jgi:ATP-dependent DNA helicase RecG